MVAGPDNLGSLRRVWNRYCQPGFKQPCRDGLVLGLWLFPLDPDRVSHASMPIPYRRVRNTPEYLSLPLIETSC